MAEPIVGMKYGTYNTLCEQNSKYYLRFKSTTRDVSFGYYNMTEIRDIWFNKENFSDHVTGTKTLDKSNSSSPHNKATLEVLYGSDSANLTILEHTGRKSLDGDDIIFNKIYGEKTFAVDHNENGVVDEGEIKPYNTIA